DATRRTARLAPRQAQGGPAAPARHHQRPRRRGHPRHHPPEGQGVRGARRRAGGEPHQPPQAVLARAGHHQGRPAALLRRRFAVPAAAPGGSRHGDEALSQRLERQVLLHEAHARERAFVAEDLLHRARVGERHRLSGGQQPGVAAVAGEPGVHRPEPLVLPLRRHQSAGLPALRPGPGARRRLRPSAADGADGARQPAEAGDAVVRQDHGVQRHPRVRAHRPRAHAEAGVELCQGVRAGDGKDRSRAGDRRIPRRQAATRAGAGGLQPERVGPHAGVGLLRPRQAGGHRLHAGDLGRSGGRHRAGGVRPEERPGAAGADGRPVEAADAEARTFRPGGAAV
ncbi:MAG: ATP-dependent DNA ligase, partial [uncultured Gemmatimonadetes bacterium]